MQRRTWFAAAAAVAAVWLLRGVIGYALRVLVGGVLIALLISPLVSLFARRLGQRSALICAWLSVGAAVTLLAVLLAPMLVSQVQALCAAWPDICAMLKGFDIDWSKLAEKLTGALPYVRSGISTAAGALSMAGMMWILSVFLLLEKEKYMLMAELLIPYRFRRSVLRILRRIARELRMYIGAQAVVAICVGTLTAVGLLLVGMPGALLLGIVTGICNLIPYFGPAIAAVPVVLAAMAEGWLRAAMAGAVLIAVQQADGCFISPKVMSGATGLSPAAVLIALAAGGAALGVMGLLLAVPGAIILRILLDETAKSRRAIR